VPDEEFASEFAAPRLAINRVYTRRGDDGTTALAGGQRLRKDDLRIEAYGTVDELNGFIGLARESARGDQRLTSLAEVLLRVQHELFNAGSILATLPEDVHPRQARITEADCRRLEGEMDHMNEVLEPLRSFVLPGGTRLNAELHVCRTVCRRAERVAVALAAELKKNGAEIDPWIIRYLNRLSDAFFVWSRWASCQVGAAETLWDPNQSASGGGG
jgi:cob(I)alamin adenosyltransferase